MHDGIFIMICAVVGLVVLMFALTYIEMIKDDLTADYMDPNVSLGYKVVMAIPYCILVVWCFVWDVFFLFCALDAAKQASNFWDDYKKR